MLCFVFAALVVLLDQFIKRWIVLTLAVGEEAIVIPGMLSLFHIENTGAAFSILSDQRWLLAGIALLAAFLLIFILMRYNEGFWGTLGLAAVLGGTVGNLIDRLFYGHVVDMFRFLFVDFAIFNIADIFITLGGLTFCIFFIVSTVKTGNDKERTPAHAHSDYDDDEPYDEYEYQEEQQELPDYDSFSDTTVLPNRVYEQEQPLQEVFFEPEQEQQVLFDPPPQEKAHYEQPIEDAFHALDILSELESEIDAIEDYDLDDLLREYGFEDK